MKKYLSAAFLISAIFLTGCNSGGLGNEPSETDDDIQLIDETETDASEEVSEAERENVQNAEDTDGETEYVKGENDFYIIVTDRNGEEKALYYKENKDEGEPGIYMEMVEDNPELMFEYRSMVSSSEPAKNGDVFFGEKLKEFVKQADFNEIRLHYSVSDGASKGMNLKRSEAPERYESLSELFVDFEPEYVPGIEGSEISEYGKYDPRYPIRYICFDYDTRFFIFNDLPQLSMDLCEYNGDIIGRLVISDYSELQKLARGPQPITSEALEEAYYKTVYCVSDWFYAGDTELYDYALKCIILSEDNKLYNVKQERTLTSYSSQGGFSDNIAERVSSVSGAIDGYQTMNFNGFYFQIPDDKKAFCSEESFIWSGGADKNIFIRDGSLINGTNSHELYAAVNIEGKTSGTYGDFELYDYAEGTFNNAECRYIFYRNNARGTFEKNITFRNRENKLCGISCSIKAEECTDEFDETVKNTFGSISLFAPDEEVREAKIKLSETPSIYSDDCYEIAEGMPFYGTTTEYKAFSPGIVEASFYAVDFENNYDIGFECYLEKQEADGLWYAVEPIGKIVQANKGASGHFYNVFEEGRKNVSFDLAAYPLLPAGKYRLAMPFWDEGGSDHDQYAAFYEFLMDEKTKTGDEIAGTASCEREEYASNVSEIKYSVDIEGGDYSVSDITDIERFENGEWISVRNCPVKTNSIGGSYALRFSGTDEVIETSGFDISKPGEYRIRISVGEVDMDSQNMFVNNYDTKYAYFKIV